MRNVITFLTSKEIIVVYIVAAIACFLAFLIYLVDKSYDKRKQRHNTRELNKLVEEVSEVIAQEEVPVTYSEPVLEAVSPSVVEEEKKDVIIEKAKEVNTTPVIEEVKAPITANKEIEVLEEDNVVLDSLNTLEETQEVVSNKEEELQYTSIEPNPDEAKEELRKLVLELEEEERRSSEDNPTIISNYEEEQENSAIISLEELVKKSKEMYAANEVTQYRDESSVPISLEDLEKTKKVNTAPIYDEPFIIGNVVSDMEEIISSNAPEQLQLSDFNSTVVPDNKVVTNSEMKEENPKDLYQVNFKKSPVISPIYGIERNDEEYLQLENTANYDKLDEEIRKTNEFLMTLKELQKNLD